MRSSNIKSFLIITAFLMLFAGCTQQPAGDAGTHQMADSLQNVLNNYSHQNPFANSVRLAWLKDIEIPDQPQKKLNYWMALGETQLKTGLTQESIETYQKALTLYEQKPKNFNDQIRYKLLDDIALAYLRLGETQNCLDNPTPASCIIPINEEGYHQKKLGSQKAISYYEKILKAGKGSLGTQWLLNIAYMTLGRYPENVPEQWLVREDAFRDGSDFPHFQEISAYTGLNKAQLSGGTIIDDFTCDGHLDVFISSWNLNHPVSFFVNNGDGSFSEKTKGAGLKPITGGLNLIQGDFNNDGYLDIYILRGAWMGPDGKQPNSLLRNNGDGTFIDISFSAGVAASKPTQTATWLDFNNDGLLDLAVGFESLNRFDPALALFKNNGDETFTDISQEAGIEISGTVKAVVSGDYNNDRYTDLYISRLGKRNLLLKNIGPSAEGTAQFEEVSAEAGVQLPIQSFPSWFWDVNNDGHLDLFVSAYQVDYGDMIREARGQPIEGDYPKLYINRGDGTFADRTGEARLDKVLYSMGSNYGDLDNDGFLDFYAGTGDPDFRSLMPSRMFRNRGIGRNGHISFEEVTYSGGFGNIQKGHAVAFADINNNGTQDIYINMGGALEGDQYQNLLFENPMIANNWITLKLEGNQSNRSAIGARINLSITERDEDNGAISTRSIHRRIGSGGSFGASPLRAEIGIGTATSVDTLKIFWPASGITQQFTDVAANAFYRIRENSSELSQMAIPSYQFDKSSVKSHQHHSASVSASESINNSFKSEIQ